MANKKIQKDPVEAQRLALEKEIAKHKRQIANIEKINADRKQLELLKGEEKKQRFLFEHPKVAIAGLKLKNLLGGTSKKIDQAVQEYKKFNKKHPAKKITFS